MWRCPSGRRFTLRLQKEVMLCSMLHMKAFSIFHL